MNRRRFLGGAAALVALPALESLFWRRAVAQTMPVAQRLFVFYFPNGMHRRDWRPTTVGEDYELMPAMQSLAPIRDKVSIVTNLSMAPAEGGDGDHARGTGCFLTAVPILQSENRLQAGISLDQAIVRGTMPSTRYPSLQLGLERKPNAGACDAGYACAYQRSIAWSGPSSPLPNIASPDVLFRRLFAGTDATATGRDVLRRRRLAASVLDTVTEEASSLSTQLGTRDRRKLDEYLTGIRELELRVHAEAPAGTCVAPDPQTTRATDVAAQTRLLIDLSVAAFQCDVTRTITFMLADSGSNRSYEFLGAKNSHHDASHHDEDDERLRDYRKIVTWEIEQFAYLARRLDAIDTSDGRTLLDECLLLCSSEISDGQRHEHHDLPVVLAGSAGGAFSTGEHIEAAPDEPIANLFLSVLHGFGVAEPTFGRDGARAFTGVLA